MVPQSPGTQAHPFLLHYPKGGASIPKAPHDPKVATEASVFICEAPEAGKRKEGRAKGVYLSAESVPFNQISQKSDSAVCLIGQNLFTQTHSN